jgi:hypothetical protein
VDEPVKGLLGGGCGSGSYCLCALLRQSFWIAKWPGSLSMLGVLDHPCSTVLPYHGVVSAVQPPYPNSGRLCTEGYGVLQGLVSKSLRRAQCSASFQPASLFLHSPSFRAGPRTCPFSNQGPNGSQSSQGRANQRLVLAWEAPKFVFQLPCGPASFPILKPGPQLLFPDPSLTQMETISCPTGSEARFPLFRGSLGGRALIGNVIVKLQIPRRPCGPSEACLPAS